MPRYNTHFHLSIEDMDLIETALRQASTEAQGAVDPRAAHDLLGRLHNQKIFYRPEDGVYISG
ncbi:hypothetical protein HKCCE3408_11960 [Rhodobacterales bacterium HKCCE3408]|nr:hypothetical protein [Rhodobacterales bacterium HKCCE3408]